MEQKDYKEFLRRLWLSIISGVIILVLSGIWTQYSATGKAVDRSIENKQKIKKLEELKEDRTNVNTTYSILSQDIQENKSDIKEFNNKVDEIKDLILKLHAK